MPQDYVRRSDDISIVHTYTGEFTGEVTDQNIISPSSGKRIAIYSLLMHGEANGGTASLDFKTSGKPVARLYFTRMGQIYSSRVNIIGGVNEALTLNISGVNSGNKTFVLVNYREV